MFGAGLLVFLMLCSIEANAQQKSAFTGRADTFPDELKSYFNSLSAGRERDEAMKEVEIFLKVWEKKLSGDTRHQIAMLLAASVALKLKPAHRYLTFINFIRFVEQSTDGEANLKAWLDCYGQTVAQSRPAEMEQLLDAAYDWMTSEKIGGKGTVSWFLNDSRWKFDCVDGQLFMTASGLLKGATKKDSTRLVATSGRLLFGKNEWHGTGGKLFWSRYTNLQAAYVQMGSYQIDLKTSGFVADSVVLHHNDLFPYPVLGSLQEQVFNSPAGEKTAYPKFTSYLSGYEVDKLFPDCRYIGAITLEGSAFVGKARGGERAQLVFFRNKKPVLQLRSETISFSKDRIQSEKAAVTISLENDSVFHPGIWFRYDNNRHQISLIRSVKGVPDGPFLDTYHQLAIFSEACLWNIGEDEMLFGPAPGLQTENISTAESLDFFSKQEYDRLQLIDAENPIAAIARYKNEMAPNGEISLRFLAEYLRKPPEQVAAQLLSLAAKGFLVYDVKEEKAWIGKRFDAVAAAPHGKQDYDVLRFSSKTEKTTFNFVLNLTSHDLVVNGMAEITLSEVQGVKLFPDNEKIILKKDRDFVFAGLVKAGLFDFYSQTGTFEYSTFKLNFSKIDSIAIRVPVREQPKIDQQKNFRYLRNVLSDLTGILRIDEPFNKSGVKDLPNFPIFNSKSESFVYYDQKNIQDGLLRRDTFYYKVDAFEIDSLDNFSTGNLRFNGYLVSGGIFPSFREPLVVMNDYSLGFEHHVPENGYPMFGGLATYYTKLQLSNNGFRGMGRIAYLSSDAFSKDFLFSPSQVTALLDRHEMRIQERPVAFPPGEGKELNMDWQTADNRMLLATNKEPYQIFGNTRFNGTMELCPEGMKAEGKMAFDDAMVDSKYFVLSSRSFDADTANFRLMASGTGMEAFYANNYHTHVDFASRTAVFSHLDTKSRLSFPFNKYDCSLDEAFWDMDRQKLTLNNNRIGKKIEFDQLTHKDLIKLNLTGSGFTSVHPKQDSLSFFCLSAEYNLKDNLILAKDVKIIRVGDAAVFPSEPVITIAKDAEIQSLANAVIIADTSRMTHTFTKANVKVMSRKSLIANGLYDYADVNGAKSHILFDKIRSDEDGKTIASGNIAVQQNFYLNPWFRFAGKVTLESGNKLLRFNGGYQLVHKCTDASLPFVAFDTLVDPGDVRLPVMARNTDTTNLAVRNGFYFAPFSESYYAAFLQAPRAASDRLLASFAGLVSYNKNASTYIISPADGKKSHKYLELNTQRCIVSGKSELTTDLKLTMFDLQMYGAYVYKMIPDSLYLDAVIALQFLIDDKLMGAMADSLNNRASLPGDGLEAFYMPALREQIQQPEYDKIANELALYGAPRKVPEYYNKTMVFSHLKLKWEPATHSLVSIGPLHIANIGKTQLNKAVNGFLEIEKTRTGDAVTVYLMPDSKTWYFFTFKNGVMQVLSSSNAFNTSVAEIKPDKRVAFDPERGGRYEYTLSTKRKMTDFLRKMQEIQF